MILLPTTRNFNTACLVSFEILIYSMIFLIFFSFEDFKTSLGTLHSDFKTSSGTLHSKKRQMKWSFTCTFETIMFLSILIGISVVKRKRNHICRPGLNQHTRMCSQTKRFLQQTKKKQMDYDNQIRPQKILLIRLN